MTQTVELLKDFLVEAVMRGLLTKEAAKSIMSNWHGEARDLPLPVESSVAKLTPRALTVAALLLADLLPSRHWKTGRKDADEIRLMIKELELSQLLALHDEAQTEFSRRARDLAMHLPDVGLMTWHQLMLTTIAAHLIQQSLLGGRGKIIDPEGLASRLETESVFLQRFASQIAIGAMTGKPLSDQAIAARARSYAGSGRELFYRALESQPFASTFVAEYIAHDDHATCQACLDAAFSPEAVKKSGGVLVDGRAFYPLGRGPFPGVICWGRDRCRCKRIPRDLPIVRKMLVS